jgi:hypothetical protein
MSQQQPPFAVWCPDCDAEKEATEPNEILTFYRRHHGLTGHEIEWKRADLDIAVPTDADLKTVISTLEEHFEDGVPIGAIVAATTEQGLSFEETMAAIYELRMEGGLYEPQDDHLRAY